MNILFYKTFAKQICGILSNRFAAFCQTVLRHFVKQFCGILSNRFVKKKSSPEGGMEVEKSGGISLLRHLPQVL